MMQVDMALQYGEDAEVRIRETDCDRDDDGEGGDS